ncbi:hypothetical protein BDW74DRAFT_182063 [Aspergillus multicolor]|uniref:uncharacterized protein n=1 Tax=Aspergillus multicolor TaxID=41759 RepID=UPI003CCD633E
MERGPCWICTCCEFSPMILYNSDDTKFQPGPPPFDIPLCPNCYVQLFNNTDPGVIIIPDDLDYFIDFEIKWQEDCKAGAIVIPRRGPDAAEYREHQIQTGRIKEDAIGGLYRPVHLEVSLSRFGRIPEFYAARPWDGEPAAALKVAFAALESPRACEMGETTYAKLWRLHSVYYERMRCLYGGRLSGPESRLRRFQESLATGVPLESLKRAADEDEDFEHWWKRRRVEVSMDNSDSHRMESGCSASRALPETDQSDRDAGDQVEHEMAKNVDLSKALSS